MQSFASQRLPKNSLHSQSLQHPSGLLTAALLHTQVQISFGKCGSDTEIAAGANAAHRCKRAAYATNVEKSDYSLGPTQGLPRSVKFSDTTRLNVDRWRRWLTIRGNQEGVALSLVLQSLSAAAGETAESEKTVL